MTLPPSIQPLVDQIIRELRLESHRPSSLHIDLDDACVAHKITPELTYRRDKETARRVLRPGA